MTKRSIPLLAFLFITFLSFGQTPQTVTRKTVNKGSDNRSSFACIDQDAGEIQEGTFTGVSNDTDFPQVYFCFGDEMNIDHIAGTADLTGDPDLGTTAGIGYGLYSALPTVSGPNLDAILLDPAILMPLPAPPAEPIWLAFGDIGGNATFNNDGSLQTFFAGGDPIEVFFAPITVDDFGNGTFEMEAGGQSGPCTNVRIDQAFSVVYLNEMTISGAALNGTTGNFTIQGGLAEFDGSNYTSILIEHATLPGVVGSTTSPSYSHGEVVVFTVPEEGDYNITITDDKGCSVTQMISGMACSGLGIEFGETVVAPNGVGCISVTAMDFTEIASLQFAMVYDPSIITLNSITNLNPNLAPDLSMANFGTTNPGQINFLYFVVSGSTVPDGAVLFDVCFDGVGNTGDVSSFGIDPNINPMLEAANTDDLVSGTQRSVCHMPSMVQIGVLSINPTVTPASCFEGDDGSIDFTVSGGNPPYTYTYQNLATAADMGNGNVATDGGMATISNLVGGQQYQIVVMDSSNPTAETIMETILVESPPEIAGQLAVLNPICAGDSTGNVALTVIYDGVTITFPDPDFTLLWNTGETTPMIGDLPAGGYEVTITHVPTNCTNNSPVGTILANPVPIDAGLTSIIATCSGFLDGSISAMPTGGTAPYSFNWEIQDSTNMNFPATTATVNNLDPGRYYITITDSNGAGCMHFDSVDVGATTIVIADEIITPLTCFGANDGAIDLTPSSIGVTNGGYSFNWNDLPSSMNPEDRADIDGNMSVPYEVTITDAIGCGFVGIYDVFEPAQIEITPDNLVDETCTVGMDGSATVSVVGGVGTLSYDWGTTPNQTTPTASNLVTGNYTVTVTDSNMCVDSLMVGIGLPDAPEISIPDTTFLDCSTSTDGSIEVMVIASSSPVASYAWSPNVTDNTAIVNNLGVGTYTVTVTTDEGCVAVGSSVIASPSPISLVDSLVVIPTCPEIDNGAVNIIVEGGTPPYSYEWSTEDSGTNTLLPGLLGDSTYCATITDSNQCEALEICVYLPIPPPITANFIDQTIISCNNGATCDGGATIVVSGGTGGNDYDFMWDSNEVDSIASGLCVGFNVVSINDGICDITDSVEIGAPDPISVDVASIVFDEPTCFGDADGGASLLATGGVPPFDYLWDTGSTTNSIEDVPAGSYNVLINDENDCEFSIVVAITQPDSLIATIDPLGTNDALCFGDTDGDISVIFSGGNGDPTTYQWTNNVSTTATAMGLPVGDYNITVTDINGCSDTTQHTINQPTPIVVQIPTPVEPACFGFQTFITLDTVFGGNPGLFTYSVDNGPQQLVNAAIPVFADITHTVSVFDSEGCRLDTMLFINQPNEVIVNLGPDIEIQLGDSVQLEPLPISALAIDTLFWTPDVALSCSDCFEPWSSPLGTQEYTFTIVDENGCSGSDNIIVEVDKNRNIYVPNIFSPNGDGFNDIFKIESGPGVVDVNFMRIFNRWGEVMFSRDNFVPGDDISGGWNGEFRGEPAPTGVYVYIIEVDFADGVTLLYRGDITIIR